MRPTNMKIGISLLAVLLLLLTAAWFLTARPARPPSVSTAQPAAKTTGDAAAADPQVPERAGVTRGSLSMPPVAAVAPAVPGPAPTAPAGAASASPSSASDSSARSRPSDASSVSSVSHGGATGAPLTAAPAEEIQYEIPAGMRAPAVMLPDDRPLTPPIQAFLDDVRREFDAKVAAAEDPAAVWEEARQHADARYRLLFGDQAYNQKTMQDAIEALRSKGALPTPPPTAPTHVVPAP